MSEENSTAINVDNVKLELSFRVGDKKLKVSEIQQIREGHVISLDSHISDPVMLLVSGEPKALGEICETDGKFSFKITKVVD